MINKSQKKVIEEARTPAVIIAGPGTGKTFTIVKKVVDLVKNEHIPANRILITTFTKKAAAELNSRILSEFTKENINTDLKDLKIGNFHSLANIYLDQYKKLDDNFFKAEVIDSYTEGYLLEKNLYRFEQINAFKENFTANRVRLIQEVFEDITNNLIDINSLKNSNKQNDRLAYEIYIKHMAILKENNLMNFQLILKNFYDLLSDSQIGEEIRNSIDFVIIDEYQDTNFIQQEIAFKLIKDKNIMVFGDDDQSLYSFRGADPKNLLDFSKVCKDKLGLEANFYSLDINYRSNQSIIDTAKLWMDVEDFDNKVLNSFKDNKNENSVVRARADNFENLYKIIKLLNKDIDLKQIGFLFPTLNSYYPKSLQAFLESKGLAVLNMGSSNFFERYEIRILMYIFTKIFTSYPSNLEDNPYLSYDQKKKLEYRKYLASLFDDQTIKSKEMDKLVSYFRNKKDIGLTEILYKSFSLKILREILDKKLGNIENDRALNNIGVFTRKVSEYEQIFDRSDSNYYYEFIYAYLFYFYKTNSIREFEDLNQSYQAINFMTIHNSKGLEFDVIFVSGLNDYPRRDYPRLLSSYSYKENDDKRPIKDFYRKYYTAFTRAKKLLVLLDNSRDYRLENFSKKLNDSSILSTIDFKRDKEKKNKQILAYTTDIEIYNACPLKYKFLRRLSYSLPKTINLIYGSRVHELSEYISKYPNDPSIELLLKNNLKYKNAILNFINQDFKVIATESNYKLDRGFYILQGNIDMILEDNSIIDIKTGSFDDLTLKKYKKQLVTYKYLMKLNNEDPKDLFLYFIESDELIKVDDFTFDIEYIDKIAKNIADENIYEKTSDIKECKFCPMKYYCHRY